jgi:hypothetical protein
MYPEEAVLPDRASKGDPLDNLFSRIKAAIVRTGVAGMHVQPVLESYLARSV